MHPTRRPLTSTLLFVFVLALVVGACADAPEPPATETPTTEDPAAENPEGQPGDDLAEGETANTPGQTLAGETPPVVAILNAQTPEPGLLTGGQPTPEQLDELAQAGYKTVVNLRTEGEEGDWDAAARSAELGLDYRRLPISTADGLDVTGATALDALLADDSLRPMVVHCGSGNRVGALFALRAFHLQDADAEAALEIGRRAGLTRLEERVRPLLVKE